MNVLTNELLSDNELTQIHQKQVREMFKTAAQLQIKEAQSNSLQKTVAAGSRCVTLLTRGLAFILPLMTLANLRTNWARLSNKLNGTDFNQNGIEDSQGKLMDLDGNGIPDLLCRGNRLVGRFFWGAHLFVNKFKN